MPVSPERPAVPVADDGRHNADGADGADAVVEEVGNVEGAIAAEGNSVRLIEDGIGSGLAVACKAGCDASGERGNDSGGDVHLADDIVAGVRDEEVLVGIEGDAIRPVQAGRGCEAVVANIAWGSVSGDGDEEASCLHDLADGAVANLGEEDIPGTIDQDGTGFADLRGDGECPTGAETCFIGSGDVGQVAAGIDFADLVVTGVGVVEIACAVDGFADGFANRSFGRQSAGWWFQARKLRCRRRW